MGSLFKCNSIVIYLLYSHSVNYINTSIVIWLLYSHLINYINNYIVIHLLYSYLTVTIYWQGHAVYCVCVTSQRKCVGGSQGPPYFRTTCCQIKQVTHIVWAIERKKIEKNPTAYRWNFFPKITSHRSNFSNWSGFLYYVEIKKQQ